MKLLIAIPALNEEHSIESIIQRSLDARRHIVGNSPVTEVEIRVVSDGSTDRTPELARRYAERIGLIIFEANRGYGAAIKEAWKNTDADLLGFLDADGTCDPKFFADLSEALVSENADLAVGCRLNKGTEMPLLRQVGNRLFALLLALFSTQRVRDTASGMRVLRREAYRKLLPLPDGLHFTPAMSARALLNANGRTKLIEIDMPYFEREGVSKLRIFRDGFRFFRIIVEALFLYRPARPLCLVGLAFLAIAAALMAAPVVHYWRARSVEEWMLYRFIFGHLLATGACLIFAAAFLARRVVEIAMAGETALSASTNGITKAFLSPIFWLIPLGLVMAGIGLTGPNLVAHTTTGTAYEHWSRFITMSFFILVATILICARVVAYCLDLLAHELAHLRHSGGEETELSFPVHA